MDREIPIEYKKEAFTLFEELLTNLNAIVGLLLNIKIVSDNTNEEKN